MPRLQPEPSLLPADLFERPRPVAASTPTWWAMYTKPRAEKAFARRFSESGGQYFLPQYPHRVLQRGRVQTSYLPLFPGYVFVYGEEADRLSALKTNLIVQVLNVTDQDQLHHELAAVHRLMQSGQGLAPEERLGPGMMVEITQGALRGMIGRVLRRENRVRFVIEVHLLQRGVSVELESWMIARSEASDDTIMKEQRANSQKSS